MNEYKTTDLSLAAVLIYYGYRLSEIEYNKPKAQFVFSEMVGLREKEEEFWSGQLSVEPKRFFNCIREIKNRLYSGGYQ